MKLRSFISTICLVILSTNASTVFAEDIKKGDTLQALTNLHPDNTKRLLYTINYQQEGLIPVCAEITVKKISRKRMVFDYQGMEYSLNYEKHTKNSGISFQQAAQDFFGPKCDSKKIASLSKTDQEGIKAGTARVGMSRDGVYFAMGRPPLHANPNLDGNEWMYWRNRFGRRAIEFNNEGKVSGIR